MSLDQQALIDRALISDVVNAYATAVDRHDWALYRSIFTDPVEIDFRSYKPDLHLTMPVDEWVTNVSRLANFDATQHISSNHVHTLMGDRARCVSYMQAGHFLTRPDGAYQCFLYGYYTNDLVRTPDGWKIARCQLTVTARMGDPRVFDWAMGDKV